MPTTGIEPVRSFEHGVLSAARLPGSDTRARNLVAYPRGTSETADRGDPGCTIGDLAICLTRRWVGIVPGHSISRVRRGTQLG